MTKKMNMINAEVLGTIAGLATCVSNDPSRYHLNCVHLRKFADHWEAVATNGHLLVVRKFPLESAALSHERYNFSPEWITALRALCPIERWDRDCEVEEIDKVEYVRIQGVLFPLLRDIGNSFPNYGEVIPADEAAFKVGLNAEYLHRIGSAINEGDAPGITLLVRDGIKAITVTGRDDNFKAYLMPLRT